MPPQRRARPGGGQARPGLWAARDGASTAPLTARGLRTRAALVAAARAVFERDGYLGAKIADIAVGAQTSHGTFYTYFSDKEEVFAAVVRDLREEIMDTGLTAGVGEYLDRDPFEAIEATIRAYLDAYRRNARIMAIIEQVSTFNDAMREAMHERVMAFVTRAASSIRRLQERGLADRELEPFSTALALSAMVSKFAYLCFVQGEDVGGEQAVTTLTRMWAGALGLRAGTAPERLD
jgi:AcrR family transcriptional regulator